MVETSDPRRVLYERLKEFIASAGRPAEEFERRLLDCKEDSSMRGPRGEAEPGMPRSQSVAKDAADAVACFANSDGGVVVLGVSGRTPGTDAWKGTVADQTWLERRIRERIKCSAVVEEVVEHIEGRDIRVLLIFAEMSDVPVADTDSHYRWRSGDGCDDIPPQSLGTFAVIRSAGDWSARPSASTVADAAPYMLQLSQWLRETNEPDKVAISTLPPEEILRELGLIHKTGKLNAAGELMCAFVPGRGPLIDLIVRESVGGPTKVRLDPAGEPVAAVLPKLELLVQAHLPVTSILSGFVREDVAAIPKWVVREAFVNAVMHRDWARSAPITAFLEGNDLSVESPGGFLPGIAESNVLTASAVRNRVLAHTLRFLRLADQQGSGVDRMYREMIRLDQRPPVYESVQEGTSVKVTVIGGPPNPKVVATLGLIPTSSISDVDQMVIFSRLLDRPTVSAPELMPYTQKSRAASGAALHRASGAGFIVETTRSGYYRFTDAIRGALDTRLGYLKRTAEEWADEIDRLLDANGEIRTRDLAEIYGVKTVRASQVLRDARARGQIELAPGPDRGNSVRYRRPGRPAAYRLDAVRPARRGVRGSCHAAMPASS